MIILKYDIQDVDVNEVSGLFFERSNYDTTCLKQLSDNLKESGQINDISLRTVGSGLQVIAGSRRFKALELAGIKTFKGKVYKNMTDVEALTMCLSENIHTKDMSSMDTAKLLKQWLDSGVKQTDIAKKLGKSSGWVSKQLKLLDIDVAAQKAISDGHITAEHARVIDVLPNKKDRESFVKKTKDGKLSVNDVKKQVDKRITRMDINKKVDALESDIVEYEQKIIEADKASNQIEVFEKRIAELDIERNNLNGQLTDESIKQKAFSISIVYEKIRPLETAISGLKSEIKALSDDRDNIDMVTIEKQYTAQAKKVKSAASKVDKIKKQLDDATTQHKAELTTLKPLQSSISDHQKLSKTITGKTQLQNQKTKALDEFVTKNQDAYNNYDAYVTEVQEFNSESGKIEGLTKEYADICAQIPSLRGKSSNKKRFEDILKRNRSELEKMKILDSA